MSRFLAALVLLAVAACAANKENPLEEKAILADLKRSLAELDKARNEEENAKKLEETVQAQIKEAQHLLAEFEKAYPKSPSLGDARSTALAVLTYIPDMTRMDAVVALANKLKTVAVKGSDHAAQADLALLNMDVSTILKEATVQDELKKIWSKNAEKLHALIKGYLAAYPRYQPALDHMADLAAMAGVADDSKTRLLILGTVAKHFPDHDLAKDYKREKAIGTVVEFTFTPVGGMKETSLKDLRGKVVLIDVWATWCGPCKQEMPGLKKLYDKYGEKGFAIVGVSLDESDKPVKAYVEENAVSWPQVVGEAARRFTEKWDIEAIPAMFLIDHQGKLRSANARGKLEELIPELLAEKRSGVGAD